MACLLPHTLGLSVLGVGLFLCHNKAAGDRPEGHQEPQEGHEPAGGVILSGEALEVALKAAQATQESVEEFIERAISTQATRDEKARSMGIKP